MNNVVDLRPAPLSDFDRFIAAYPRKTSIGYARGRWIWALAKVNNDAEQIIAGAQRAADYHRKQGTPLEFIREPYKWLDGEGWLDILELPKPVQQSPQEQQQAMREMMERKAAAGSRFAQDWLKRQ